MKYLVIVVLSLVFISCASSDEQDPDRYPATDEHSSLPVRAIDKDYWEVCLKERSESYCRRRLGYGY